MIINKLNVFFVRVCSGLFGFVPLFEVFDAKNEVLEKNIFEKIFLPFL